MDDVSVVAEFLKDYGFVQPNEDYSFFKNIKKTSENENDSYDADYYYSGYYDNEDPNDEKSVLKTITKNAITTPKEVSSVVFNDNMLDRMDGFLFNVPKLNEKIVLVKDHIINGILCKKGTIIERIE